MRARFAKTVLGASVIVVLAGARTHTPAPHAVGVSMKSVSYAPASISASVGDTIVWTNEDILTHTVTADTAKWDSGDLPARKQYRLVVKAKGTISYHCELHPTMKGSVVVK